MKDFGTRLSFRAGHNRGRVAVVPMSLPGWTAVAERLAWLRSPHAPVRKGHVFSLASPRVTGLLTDERGVTPLLGVNEMIATTTRVQRHA
jgi:hypothetical protein